MKIRAVLTATLLLTTFATAQETRAESQFKQLEFLIGSWKGTTHGEPGEGTGERKYELVLSGKFLRGSNKTTYPPQAKNPKGEVHEDVAYFSYDRQQKRLVLRQFHVEGFVNEYLSKSVSSDGKTVVFETERIENIPPGWRARETYHVVNADEFTERFELAEPGKDFKVYSESRWKRVP